MTGATKMNGDVSNVFLNMSNRGTNSGTLGHEIAHQFGGEVRSRFAGIANAFTVGGANAVMDISNDFRLWQLRGEKAFSQASHWTVFGRYPDPWRRNASSWFGKRR